MNLSCFSIRRISATCSNSFLKCIPCESILISAVLKSISQEEINIYKIIKSLITVSNKFYFYCVGIGTLVIKLHKKLNLSMYKLLKVTIQNYKIINKTFNSIYL